MPIRPTFTFRLDENLRTGLHTVWERDGIAVSEQVRRAIQDWLAKKGRQSLPSLIGRQPGEITTRELLASINITRRSLSKWQSQGKLPPPITRQRCGLSGPLSGVQTYWSHQAVETATMLAKQINRERNPYPAKASKWLNK